ncbi:MAG: hypothetical protein NTY48_02700 [Candidatus Diapherotrites archaeon]|nr:hypothetical protein [Candidatus Diapherotrites archaeon]
MSKENKNEHSSHHESKSEHSSHHEHKEQVIKAKPLGFGWNLVALVLVLVLGASLVGTLVGFSAGVSSSAGLVNSAGFSNTVVDKSIVAAKVEGYFNENLSARYPGVSAKVADINSKPGNAFDVEVDVYQNGAVAEKGNLVVQVMNNKILLVQDSFDMNKEFKITPATAAPANTASTQAVKSDKPVADLYVFSYCPAGTAALDAFAKAADVLKTSANVKVKFFANIHGDHELQQNKIQECIQVVDGNKYWVYAQKFVEQIYPNCGSSGDVSCNLNESVKLMNSLGIDSNKVMDCVAKQGDALYASDKADAGALQLQYSPSIVVNGVYLPNADRSPEGLKKTICDGFNTAPTICSQALSTVAATASGSCGS